MDKKRVIIYGLGQGFEGFLNLFDGNCAEIIGCIDRNAKQNKYSDKYPVLKPEELSHMAFDYVLICSRDYQWEMAETLRKENVPLEKIVVAPNCLTIDATYQNTPAIKQMFGEADFPVHATMGPRLPFQNCDDADYVRRLTLARASKMLHKYQVKGDCAELGVFRGDFARLINEVFPESRLYLFDTFEGFDERDIATDRQFDLSVASSASLYEKLKDTSVQTVLDKMPFPEKCVVKKGYFPDTTEGMPKDARFAFVSIDADLYIPILKGLEYFYPRMEHGGMILVHDYVEHGLGAGRAVDEFCKSNGIIPVPVADEYSSVVIVRL